MSHRSGSSLARSSLEGYPFRPSAGIIGAWERVTPSAPRPGSARDTVLAPRFERIAASTLAGLMAESGVRVIDLRRPAHSLESPYAGGHVPGASWLDVDSVLAGPRRRPRSILEFAAAMARHGVGDEDVVVLYDEVKYDSAAALGRAMVEYGHRTVGVLVGGWEAWLAGGYPVDSVPHTYPPASYTARNRSQP